jgi:hypothetical protein
MLYILPTYELFTVRRRRHESEAEFDGRALCLLEERVTGTRAPMPKGTRYAREERGLWSVYESTGAPYANRARYLGTTDETGARAIIARRA